jgi:hypothetical protein
VYGRIGFVLALDERGQNLWFLSTQSGPQWTSGVSDLALHPAGGIIAVGMEVPVPSHTQDGFVLRIDAGGSILWKTTSIGSGMVTGEVNDVDLDASGNVYLLSEAYAPFAAGWESSLVRLDPLGNLLGSQSFPPLPNSGHEMQIAPGGDLMISRTESLMRVATNGNVLWTLPIQQNPAVPMCIGPDGSCYVATGSPADPWGAPFQVSRVDASGSLQWTTIIADATYSAGLVLSLAYCSSGLVVAAGARSNAAAVGSTIPTGFIAGFDQNGNVVWTQSNFPPLGGGAFQRVADVGNGEVAFQAIGAGLTSAQRMVVGRLDSNGALLWYESPPVETPYFLPTLGVDTLTPGSTITLSYKLSPAPSGGDVHVMRLENAQPGYCFGDGSSVPCPCGNVGAVQSGCASSVSGSGGRLMGFGVPSVSSDSLRLVQTSVPSGPSLLFQASTAGDFAFGDGKLCASQGFIRLGVAFASAGEASFPGSALGPAIHLLGAVSTGSFHYYQSWYRDAAPNFCSVSLFNLTNGLMVRWLP